MGKNATLVQAMNSPSKEQFSRLKHPGKLVSRAGKASASSSPVTSPRSGTFTTSKATSESPSNGKPHTSPRLPLSPDSGLVPESDDQAAPDVRSGTYSGSTAMKSPTATSSRIESPNDKLKELESALTVTQGERQALSEEMERLRQRESIYQAAIEEYKQDLLRAESHRQAIDRLREDIKTEVELQQSWAKERAELQGQIRGLQAELSENDRAWRKGRDNERAERLQERNEHFEELHAAQKQIYDREEQLLSIKQSISALTHIESQTTDNDIVEAVNQLYYRIREWVISNFRRAKLGM